MLSFFHPFHIVSLRPWPILAGIVGLYMTTSIVVFFKFHHVRSVFYSLLFFRLISFFWWRDVSREGIRGDHSSEVQDGLKWGIALFIFREVLFFVAWFWAFFHNSTVPVQDLGNTWPPVGVFPINPFQVPLLNTIILLSRGITVTWAHHNLIKGYSIIKRIVLTITLGFLFTLCQLIEYIEASFSIAERAFGRRFFVTTGFHGLHVIIGTLFLLFIFIRSLNMEFSANHHIGAEFAIWYWHFVDVVWLFLFSFIYWWTI